MADRRYFEHDYENEVTTEYTRLGECNGCGECCKNTLSLRNCATAEERKNHDSLFVGSGVEEDGV